MAGFIEELFYGNIDSQARSTTHNLVIQKEMQRLIDYEKGWYHRRTQGNRPDGMGTANEFRADADVRDYKQ